MFDGDFEDLWVMLTWLYSSSRLLEDDVLYAQPLLRVLLA